MPLKRAASLLFAAGLVAFCRPAANSAQRIEDHFEGQLPPAGVAWIADSPAWDVSKGRYEYAGGPGSFSICDRAQPSREVSAEVAITVKEATGADWKVAGLAIVQDPRNYWHVALVEQPDSQGKGHFVELREMYRGRWLADSEEPTRLTAESDPARPLDWKYDHPYRLRIEMKKGAIAASLSEMDGTSLARFGFRLDNAAVASGRPALHCAWLSAAFDDFAAQTGEPASPAEPQLPAFRVPSWAQVRGKATGFYHVEQRDGTWWVIDPKGHAFYIIGTDHANYNVHWCEALGYAPYHKFCEEKYGSERAWAGSTIERLKAWGFNSLGANHSPSLRYGGLAHTEFLSLGQKFAAYDNIVQPVHWTGFPDVFSPKFREFCQQQAVLQCAPNKDDPWLLGYFLDNELEWYGKSYGKFGLFDEAFKKPADHPAKKALVDFLRGRYDSAEAMGKAWSIPLSSFDSLLEAREPPPALTPDAQRDKLAFVRKAAELYFSITADAVKRADPNHMILGCRFAGQSPNVWDIAGRYCDIVSVNCYRRVDLDAGVEPSFVADLAEWHSAARRPLMITEWSFPALDSGLPCTHGAGERFDTQEQRTKAFSIFQRFLFSQPFMVGSDFFMWVDEPAEGISSTFPENTNYGLVNGRDEPYELLTGAAEKLHHQVYALHSGETAELRAEAAPNGRDMVLSNQGKIEADCTVRAWLDGVESETKLSLAPGERRTYSPTQVGPSGGSPGVIVGSDVPILSTKAMPGCHSLAVVIDPDGEVPERVREDNHARATWYNPGLESGGPLSAFSELAPVAVTSGAMPVSDLAVTIPLGSLPWKGPLSVADAAGAPVPFQLDRLQQSPELCFSAGDMRPFDCRTFFVCRAPGGEEPGAPPVLSAFDIDNGFMKLSKHSDNGDLLDGITASGIALGQLRALFEVSSDGSDWPRLDRFVSASVSRGPVRTAVDITAELSGTLSTCYRLTIYPNKKWFAARMLWVENIGGKPLNIRRYYHYPVPAIGGSSQGDIVGPPSVPNYYRKVGLWYDPGLEACYGALAGSDEFQQTFWIDDRGGYHPDFSRELNATLAPGEKYDAAQPQAWIFGGPCPDPRESTLALWERMRARSAASARVFSPEKRAPTP